MKIEEIADNLGKEVELKPSTQPYTDVNGTIPTFVFYYDKILLTEVYDFGNVVICFYCKGTFVRSQTIKCRHLQAKQYPEYKKWLELDIKGTSVEYYSESLERWDNILNIPLAELKLQSKFRVAPKYVYLEGKYCEEDLAVIIKELKKQTM